MTDRSTCPYCGYAFADLPAHAPCPEPTGDRRTPQILPRINPTTSDPKPSTGGTK